MISGNYSDKIRKRLKDSIKEKYGVDNVSQIQEVVDKRKRTIFEKYGKVSYAQTDEFRELQEKAGVWMSLDSKSDFEIYRMLVWSVTNKLKKQLFKEWDGLCYYTGEELIRDPKRANDILYATIDHKTSIYAAHRQGMLPAVAGGLDNLCVCSRSVNSKKHIMTEKQFRTSIE